MNQNKNDLKIKVSSKKRLVLSSKPNKNLSAPGEDALSDSERISSKSSSAPIEFSEMYKNGISLTLLQLPDFPGAISNFHKVLDSESFPKARIPLLLIYRFHPTLNDSTKYKHCLKQGILNKEPLAIIWEMLVNRIEKSSTTTQSEPEPDTPSKSLVSLFSSVNLSSDPFISFFLALTHIYQIPDTPITAEYSKQLLQTCEKLKSFLSLFLIKNSIPDSEHAVFKGITWDFDTFSTKLTSQGLFFSSDHTYSVTSVAISPNSRFIASGSKDNTVKLWGYHVLSKSFKLLRTFTEHKNDVNSLSFSPNSQYLVSGSSDKTLEIFDTTSLNTIHVIPMHHFNSVFSVSWCPDNRFIASCSLNEVKIWDPRSGKCLGTLEHPGLVQCVTFSPDSKFLASSSVDKKIKLWDTFDSFRCFTTFSGHSDWVHSLAWYPDSKYLVSGSRDSSIRIWNIESSENIVTFNIEPSACIHSVSFSLKYVASSSSDNRINLWDPITSELIGTIIAHTDRISSISFSPDGKYIVSGSWDKTLKIWDISQILSNPDGLSALAKGVPSAPDSVKGVPSAPSHNESDSQKVLESSSSRSFQPWSIFYRKSDPPFRTVESQSSRLFGSKNHSGSISSIAISPDSRYFVSGSTDKTVKKWEYDNSSKSFLLQKTLPAVHAVAVQCVAISPDSKLIATSSYGKIVKIFDAATFNCKYSLECPNSHVLSMDWAPKDNFLAVSSFEQVLIWEIDKSSFLTLIGHTALVHSVSFSPDGKYLLSGSNDHTVRIWDCTLFSTLRILQGHTSFVYTARFSPDMSFIATGSSDETVRIWSARTYECLAVLKGHTYAVTSVVWAPNSRLVASASYDFTIKIWDMETFKCLGTLKEGHTARVNTIQWSPDSRFIISGANDCKILVWDVGFYVGIDIIQNPPIRRVQFDYDSRVNDPDYEGLPPDFKLIEDDSRLFS